MSAIQITISSIAVLSAVFLGFFLYIRRQYRIFCRREDQKEHIALLRRQIESARDFIRKNYTTQTNRSIYDNIVPKMEFIEKLILHKPLEEQEKEFQFLLNMLTETFVRLKTSYDDVQGIVSPLNTLRDRLVQEHLSYLRTHMDGEMEF